MKNILKGAAVFSAVAPFAALAQGQDASGILGTIGGLINQAIPILIAAAILFFIYGVVRFVIASDADEKGKAKSIIINGVIGLAVIVSMWGIVGVLQSTLGIGSGGTINESQIPGVQF